MARQKKKQQQEPLQVTEIRGQQALDRALVRVSGADALRRTTSELKDQGYFAAPMPDDFGHTSGGNSSRQRDAYRWQAEYIHEQVCGHDAGSGRQLPFIFRNGGTEVMTPDGVGSKGLGWMQWGASNRNPNAVSMLTEISPYTASAHRFNTDLCAGRGPRPVYAYVQYVGGNLTEKRIPYQNAGVLIKGWLRDLRRELQQEQERQRQSQGEGGGSSSVGGYSIATPAVSVLGGSTAKEESLLTKDLKEQIAALEADYAEWERTNRWLFTDMGLDGTRSGMGFLQRNNLHATYLSLTADMQQHNICFPELTLNQRQQEKVENPLPGQKSMREVPTSRWTPQVIGLRYRMAHTCRLERRGRNGKIAYVYVSTQWLDENLSVRRAEDFQIAAIPALDPQQPAADMMARVRDARTANVSVRRRPTRFILPVTYTSPGRPYYPVPANQSIYSGDIYEYLTTMISDRKKRRDNSNVIGRIIYLNQEYMERLYHQKKADTPEDRLKVFTQLRDQINTFLSDRDNAGKPLVAYTFLGTDGKVYESWKIVEIEANDKGSVEANQKELAEVSSIVFFAYGLDSRLVGNTPGDVTSSGGTDLRERYMLKQLQMSPMQQLLLSPLYVIKDFNHLDSHLEWEIPREVLTTLDNSKTGITTQPQP